jgi:hypothetical protein
MTLLDEIIDTAKEMAEQHVLDNPTPQAIVDTLSVAIRVPIDLNSTGAKLAIATYQKYDLETLYQKVA